MRPSLKNSLFIVSFVLLAFITTGSIISAQDGQDKLYKKFDIFVEVLNKIRTEYVEQVKPEEIFEGALKGMASQLDSESSFMTVEEYAKYKSIFGKQTAGTGANVIKHPGNRYAMVVSIQPGSPAEKAGLKRGDFIRAIDNKSTTESSTLMMEQMMLGDPGSEADFSVIRGGVQGLLNFKIKREELVTTGFSSSIKDSVGYMKISSFDSFVLEEIEQAAEEFSKKSITSVIIDVRDNISRNLDEAMHTAGLFVSGKPLINIVSKDNSFTYTANEPKISFSLIVLINDATARSAEAFALSLKKSVNAELIGENTMGLATQQRELFLEDGSYLNISYATLEAVDGMKINGSGLKPDVEVDEKSEDKTDLILERALQRAKEKSSEKAAA